MGKITGFMDFKRTLPKKRPVSERIKDYRELYLDFSEPEVKEQAARCMDCGVPFCHTGCPLGNIIPDWNDLVYRGRWREAIDRLHATNNFPEFTGRLCPAPCEEACVLGINEPAVAIEEVEKQIVERAFSSNWIKPEPPETRTGKKVVVIGSGPAGLAAAQQLNRAGHQVVVMERSDRVGGLLRYGIPDFKMEKRIIDRRVAIMKKEGIEFKTSVAVGKDIKREELDAEFDAVVFAGGSTRPRDLPIEGRELDGVVFAMDFLPQQNKIVAGDAVPGQILATGKHVVVIGGGDTGSDCIGTSTRQGAISVTNFELLPEPPKGRPESQPWPYWPMRLRNSSSHVEAEEAANGIRQFSALSKKFVGEDGKVTKILTAECELKDGKIVEIPGTDKEWPCDLAVLAMGFVGPETDTIVSQYGAELDARGNVKVDQNFMSSVPGFFAAGDAQRGQSLIVWAISDGRETARAVDLYLMGSTLLPTKDGMDLPRR
ncbi:MAG: glutamate synthase (NADPH/NADH) small chain [Kiritimatiellia bacterium]|jgi:glutamate synthase (NADPH/NADH) small chain